MRKRLLPLAAAGLILATTPVGAGARVRAVRAGSPAAKAGVQPGDVVLAAAGRDVRSGADLHRALSASGRQSMGVRRGAGIRILMLDLD